MNSYDVKKIVGERLQKVRNDRGFTREKLCDRLNRMEDTQIKSGTIKALQADTLKQWELGKNQINVMWIPAILKVLHCDVGYIFGEYEAYTRQVSDVKKETGLSESAIQWLMRLRSYVKEDKEDFRSELSSQRLQFYSAFIADTGIFGLTSFFPSHILEIQEQGLSEKELDVFSDKEQAIDFFRFEASQAVLRFIDRFISSFEE